MQEIEKFLFPETDYHMQEIVIRCQRHDRKLFPDFDCEKNSALGSLSFHLVAEYVLDIRHENIAHLCPLTQRCLQTIMRVTYVGLSVDVYMRETRPIISSSGAMHQQPIELRGAQLSYTAR